MNSSTAASRQRYMQCRCGACFSFIKFGLFNLIIHQFFFSSGINPGRNIACHLAPTIFAVLFCWNTRHLHITGRLAKVGQLELNSPGDHSSTSVNKHDRKLIRRSILVMNLMAAASLGLDKKFVPLQENMPGRWNSIFPPSPSAKRWL